MIDPARSELLQLIEQLSAACPEYRFGQLVLNLAFFADFRGGAISLFRTHFLGWSGRFFHGEHRS
jgi:hypothetical protein